MTTVDRVLIERTECPITAASTPEEIIGQLGSPTHDDRRKHQRGLIYELENHTWEFWFIQGRLYNFELRIQGPSQPELLPEAGEKSWFDTALDVVHQLDVGRLRESFNKREEVDLALWEQSARESTNRCQLITDSSDILKAIFFWQRPPS